MVTTTFLPDTAHLLHLVDLIVLVSRRILFIEQGVWGLLYPSISIASKATVLAHRLSVGRILRT